MVIQLGYAGRGRRGLVVVGAAFIAPAMLMVLVLSAAYVRYGATPQAERLLDGVNAAAVALMAGVTAELAVDALVDPLTVGVGVAALGLVWRTSLGAVWLLGGGAGAGLAAGWLGLV